MKKTIILLTLVLACSASLHSQTQSCDEHDLSNQGRIHYNKYREYVKNLTQGTHELAIAELEALLKTDGSWCPIVYKLLGILYEDIYPNKSNSLKNDYLNRAILYYKKYLAWEQDDDKVMGSVAKLEAQKEILQKTIDNAIYFEMVYVEGQLNQDTTDCIHSFYISKYEVTQKQWQAIMLSNPSHFKGPNLPVENMNIKEVTDFFLELNNINGSRYRLPTAAEWELAARGGKQGLKSNSWHAPYAGGFARDKYGWFNDIRTYPVGKKEPNFLGIYDMSGNVAELCSDDNNKYKYYVAGGSFKREQSISMSNCTDFKTADDNGFRVVLPVESFSEEERKWDQLISKKRERIRLQERILDSIRSEEKRILDSIRSEEKRNADALKALKEAEEARRKYMESFLPIIQFDKGFWGTEKIGYDFSRKKWYAGMTFSPGPLYTSVLLNTDTMLHLSAGISLDVINRFKVLLGVAWKQEDKSFGADVGIAAVIKGTGIGISGGAMLFQDEVIPHMGVFYSPGTTFKPEVIYGYSVNSRHSNLGMKVNYSNMYAALLYQLDTSIHTMIGINILPLHTRLSLYAGIAYHNKYGFGLDLGAGFGLSDVELKTGVIKYKEETVPTLGVKMNMADIAHITPLVGYDYKEKAFSFGLAGALGFVYASAMYQTNKSYYLSIGCIGNIVNNYSNRFETRFWSNRENREIERALRKAAGLPVFDSRRNSNSSEFNIALRGGLVFSNVDKIGLDAGVLLSFDDWSDAFEDFTFSIGTYIFKDKLVPSVGIGGLGGLILTGVAGVSVGIGYLIKILIDSI